MNPHVTAITLGVTDLARAKRFYAEGLGWPVQQDYPDWVAFAMSEGSSSLGLFRRDGIAAEAGIASAGGNGYSGVTLSYIVRSDERVDAVLDEAKTAGGTIVKPGQQAQWGGYFGYFADPDGFLWKVTVAVGEQPASE